ncbi:ABC-type glycerol-3-phosphate transport system, substrate-binding protein [Kaistia soli DSM 19436]|uniref:ABC-type glycerol-3-phosphate transport system, substrate-binding protein n=1 Tax=Kaistia soli DSM 19436 TaxID=1122133 RepID=A0A1M4WMK8_9HYPH|nr:extracellular solute-binding protein [Kaistia soli]SHE82417.1 ABC-type glycerol-3-phosphate transport system, substrate-binding protein [Kaistia soli DSM 19436]
MLSRIGTIAVAAAFAASPLWIVGQAAALELNVFVPAAYSPSSGFIPGADVFKKLYAEFQKQNPDITLNYEVLDPGPAGLQKLLTVAASNGLPDVTIVDGQWIARLVQSNVLQPLDAVWPESDRADFHPAVIEAETIDGKPFGIMFQTGMRGLVYRPSMLASAGLTEFPATFDAFMAAGKTLKDKGISAEMVPAKANEEPSTMHMLSIFWGLGGKLVDEKGAPVFFEGDNGKYLADVYQMYRDMAAAGVMPASVTTMDENGLKPFFYGGETLAIGFSSSGVKQMWSEMPDLANDLAVAPYPMPEGEKPVTILGGFAYALTAKDPERAAAGWKFIQFMTSPKNMGEVNEVLGALPVRNSIWKDNTFFATNPMMQSYKRMYDGEMQTRPAVPIYNTISSAISAQLAGVISGQVKPVDAVAAARDAVMPEYERQKGR